MLKNLKLNLYKESFEESLERERERRDYKGFEN